MSWILGMCLLTIFQTHERPKATFADLDQVLAAYREFHLPVPPRDAPLILAKGLQLRFTRG